MQAGVNPPTTFGVLLIFQTGLLGSTRSGLKAIKRSSPTLSRPAPVSAGKSSSRVVPGYVVDSSTTSCPDRMVRCSDSVTDMMYETSGSPVLLSGVGTQMQITSGSLSCA